MPAYRSEFTPTLVFKLRGLETLDRFRKGIFISFKLQVLKGTISRLAARLDLVKLLKKRHGRPLYFGKLNV